MTMTDPIADMLTRIRNALLVRKSRVDVRRSRVCLGIARILKEEGFIEDYREIEDGRQGLIRIYLKYGPEGEQVIRGLERVSKPGRRIYRKVKDIQPLLRGIGVGIYSTPKGILTDRQCLELRVGGEFLAKVY